LIRKERETANDTFLEPDRMRLSEEGGKKKILWLVDPSRKKKGLPKRRVSDNRQFFPQVRRRVTHYYSHSKREKGEWGRGKTFAFMEKQDGRTNENTGGKGGGERKMKGGGRQEEKQPETSLLTKRGS